jgi:hypothetical protein
VSLPIGHLADSKTGRTTQNLAYAAHVPGCGATAKIAQYAAKTPRNSRKRSSTAWLAMSLPDAVCKPLQTSADAGRNRDCRDLHDRHDTSHFARIFAGEPSGRTTAAIRQHKFD